MGTENCNHITYEEIERYLCVGESVSVLDDADLEVIDSFENKLNECSVCQELMQAFTILAALEPVKLSWTERVEAFKDKLLEKTVFLGELISGFLPDFQLAGQLMGLAGASRGAGGECSESSEDTEDMTNELALQFNESGCFEFEITENMSGRKIFIEIPGATAECTYNLHLIHENDDIEGKDWYIAEDDGLGLAVVTKELPAGKYVGIIVEKIKYD